MIRKAYCLFYKTVVLDFSNVVLGGKKTMEVREKAKIFHVFSKNINIYLKKNEIEKSKTIEI